jgi:transcriptional regulator GlxA family with amidase domain
MSPRNFAGLFMQAVGTTPARHIEDTRLEAARRLLESTSTLDKIADASGFASAEIVSAARSV